MKKTSTHAQIFSKALPQSLAGGIADLCKAPDRRLHQSIFMLTDTLRPHTAACKLFNSDSQARQWQGEQPLDAMKKKWQSLSTA